MAAEIEKSFPHANVQLLEGGRGDFLVKRDGAVLWDKRNDQGRFPEHAEVIDQL